MTTPIRLYDNTRVNAFRTCPRYFLFAHVYHWQVAEKSSALIFGSSWHAAMDVIWHPDNVTVVAKGTKVERRKLISDAAEAFEAEWVKGGLPASEELSPDDLEFYAPRTPQIAAEMLHGYIEQREHIFSDPSFKVLAIERPFAVPLSPDDPSLFYVGRLDKVFEYRKEILCAEHKCLGEGTPVLMYDGSIKNVEEIIAGDLLMGPDSQPRRVLETCSGEQELYKVTPKSGEPYVVNEEHILSLKIASKEPVRLNSGRWRYDGTIHQPDSVVNVSVRDYLRAGGGFRTNVKGWRTGVEFSAKPLHPHLPPYLLGVWLGDGTAANQGITTMDREIVEVLEEYAIYRDLKITAQKKPAARCATYFISKGSSQWKRNPLVDALNELNLLGNKHVPFNYKTGNRETRLQVLAGIIDTDGGLQQNGGGGYRISQKSKQISEDICFLARSLGLGASMYLRKSKCTQTGAVGDYFWVYLSGPCHIIPCKLARKRSPKKEQRVDVLRTAIAVESIGKGRYFGFEVEGPNGLFMLGDFTVTHNTTTAYKKGGPFRADWVDSFNVSAQIDGYIFALRVEYGSRAGGVWIDGSLVHKTEHAGFRFLPESRSEGHLDSWLWETHNWIDQIEGNKAAYAERAADDTNYLAAFPRNTNSCVQYGRCPYLDVCRVVANPAKLDGPPLGYVVKPWSPFEIMKLEQLGFTVEGSGEPVKPKGDQT